MLALGFLHGCGGSTSPTISPKEHPDYDNHRAVGASAHDLLSADKYPSVTIEIQAMTGFRPTQATQDALKAFVTQRCNKTGGVTVVVDADIPAQGKSAYSLDDTKNIEVANRQLYTTGTTLSVYFLFLDGPSTDDNSSAKILAYAYLNTSMVVFEKTIQGLSGLPPKPSTATVEQAVVEHELGHLLGLVNLSPGSPMQASHQDTAHGNHCNDSTDPCLMYYAVNTSNIIGNLLGGIPQLDANCLADLKANGGK